MTVRRRLLLLAGMVGAVLLLTPLVGVERIPVGTVLEPFADHPAAVILWRIRLPRVLAAAIAGAALASGGAAFQSLFRNPLATPFTLGVASGAAFGVALAGRVGVSLLPVVPAQWLGAFAGAVLAVATVWLITHLRPSFTAAALLLAGVAMSFLFSSLILFLQYTASLGDSYRIVRWLMGGLGGADPWSVATMAPFALGGIVILLWNARELDLLALGADLAASRGVEVLAVRRAVFLATSVMVGGVVAVCGPIGFVGMMAPHICRFIVGADHRALLPASCLFGAAFLILCDTGARLVLAPVELPVGVITAFLGGPFFLWLLMRRGGV